MSKLKLTVPVDPDVEQHPFGLNDPPSGRYVQDDGKPVPSVTEILKDIGLTKFFDKIPSEVLERKGAIGTRVHNAIEKRLEDKDGSVPEDAPDRDRVLAYLDSFERLRCGVDFRPLALEMRIVVPHMYGGTVDFIGYVDGALSIVDWKPRARGSHWYDGLQLAAYASLAAASARVPQVDPYQLHTLKRYICALNEKGKPGELIPFDNIHDYDAWAACVRVWKIRQKRDTTP